MLTIYIISAIVVSAIFGVINMSLRSRKGYQGGFWLGFFFGILALIYSAGLPDYYANRTNVALRREVEELYDDLYKLKHSINNIDDNNIKKSQKRDGDKKNVTGIVSPEIVSDDKIKCPVCNFIQPKGRIVCWQCGTKFKDE